MADAERKLSNGKTRIDFQTEPARYRHWKLRIDGEVATLLMDVDEKGTLFEGYELKLNSYDLGVDIELADALERLRFEHPSVKVVLLRSGKPRVFCAGGAWTGASAGRIWPEPSARRSARMVSRRAGFAACATRARLRSRPRASRCFASSSGSSSGSGCCGRRVCQIMSYRGIYL